MRGFVYNGHDFGEYVRAQVTEMGGHGIEVEALKVKGRPGARILSGRIGVKRIGVRMYLDAGYAMDAAQLSDVRHRLLAWLAAPEGAELVLPDGSGLRYRDVVCASAGAWSSNHEDAFCDLVFYAYDPVAYGEEHAETGTAFTVEGTWETLPVMELTAAAGSAVSVACGGKSVSIGGTFSAGAAIVIDFGNETVTVGGVSAESGVSLGSTFFALKPGAVSLTFTGCSAHTVRYTERWL